MNAFSSLLREGFRGASIATRFRRSLDVGDLTSIDERRLLSVFTHTPGLSSGAGVANVTVERQAVLG